MMLLLHTYTVAFNKKVLSLLCYKTLYNGIFMHLPASSIVYLVKNICKIELGPIIILQFLQKL